MYSVPNDLRDFQLQREISEKSGEADRSTNQQYCMHCFGIPRNNVNAVEFIPQRARSIRE